MKKYQRFHSIVTKNEFTAIRGPGFRSVIYLSGILFITFLSIGFANNALLYQDKLAKNPLSNWIDIEINQLTGDSTERLVSDLSDTILKNKYFLKNLYFSKEFGASFLNRKRMQTGLPLPKVRTIDPGSSIIHDLFNKNNVVSVEVPDNVFHAEPFGFIVTEAFLEKLGFHYDSVTCLSYRLYKDKYVPVPILGVVRELPDHADAVCTDAFYKMQLHNYPDDSVFSKLFIDTRNPVAMHAFKGIISKEAGFAKQMTICDSTKGFKNSLYILYFSNKFPQTRLLFKDNLSLLANRKEFQDVNYGTFFEVKKDEPLYQNKYGSAISPVFHFDYLVVEFSKLDKIRDFSEYIRYRYKISINMETVAQRQNYLFSLNTSLGAIILVITLAVLAIVIFISNTLRNHLERVKRNLGNYLAFGASGNQIAGIYMLVVLKILCVSTATALFLANITGELFDRYLLKSILALAGDQDFFSLFNMWLVLFIMIVFIVAVVKTLITVLILVRKSPGDLIHEREKQKR